MTRLICVAVLLLVALSLGAPNADADSTVFYPGGSVSLSVNIIFGPPWETAVFGGMAFLFADNFSGGVFVHTVTPEGGFTGALWLEWIGTSSLGQAIYDVYGSSDGSTFIYLETILV